MSSASSGRYQSKLFNLVHQQSRRLSEGCVRAFRHLQVATTWSVQALLYPVYLLISNEGRPRQIHSPTQHSSQLGASTDSQLQTPPASDTSIQRVLLGVNTLSTEESLAGASTNKKENPLLKLFTFLQFKFLKIRDKSHSHLAPSPLHPLTPRPPYPFTRSSNSERPTIQGIATQLATRTLVLVTAQNEVLDILTPQQQQELQQRIIEEVAEYWRYWRLHLNQPQMPQAIAFLDRTVAELESSSLAPLSVVASALTQRSQNLSRSLRTQLDVYRFGRVRSTDTQSELTSDSIRTSRIQALIWAAVNYFFGDRKKKQLGGGETEGSVNSPLPSTHRHSQLGNVDEDPWLTMNDLFGSAPAEDLNSQLEVSREVREQHHVLPSEDPFGSIWRAIQSAIAPPQQPSQAKPVSKLVEQKEGKGQRVKSKELEQGGSKQSPSLPKILNQPTQTVSTGEVMTQSHSQGTQMEHTPDWIETPAAAMGYVKHPLEQLLEWLDRAMLWLEKGLIKVWQWLRSFIRTKR